METDRNIMRSVDALRICMGLIADLEIAVLQPVRTTINVHPEPVHTRELGGVRCCGGASRFCFNRCRHGGKRGLLQLPTSTGATVARTKFVLQPVHTTINVHPEPVHTNELGGIRCCGGASRGRRF